MSTNDPNWSDDGFDSMDDGFMPRQTKAAEPVSAFQRPVPPPPVATSSKTNSPRRAVVFLLLFFITAIGLVITWVSRSPEPRGGQGPAKVSTATQEQERPMEPPEQVIDAPQIQAPTPTPSPKTSKQKESEKPRDVVEAVKETPRVPEPEKVAPVPKETPRRQDVPSTRTTSSMDQEWCVQVFASTSPDDADEWNNRLKAKNIDDSRIEMVDRQGQLWYRVRFGRFSTKQEAEQIAQRMGFRNAWVNRAR
jgi:septal ring-binding cell division protein DamX